MLICEDNPAFAREIAERLTLEGATVLGPFAFVVDAKRALDRHFGKVGAAVLDWNLADGTVEPIAAILASRNVPFLFCTSDESQVQGWPGHPVVAKSYIEWVVPQLATLLCR